MKGFPIMRVSREDDDQPRAIPWEMIAPHEAQALRNHDQTLKRLAERGGLCPSEALAVLEGRRFRQMGLAEARDALKEMVAVWIADVATPRLRRAESPFSRNICAELLALETEAFDPCI